MFFSDENYEHRLRFVNIRNIEALRKIISSMKASLTMVQDESDLISYNDLRNPVKVDFKNVIQLFLEYNTNLRPQPKKFWFFERIWNCEEIDNDLFKKGDGCFGTVRSCVRTDTTCLGSGLIHFAFGEDSKYYYEFGRLSVCVGG